MGIPVVINPFILADNSSANAAVSTRSDVYGFALGTDHAHARYASIVDQASLSAAESEDSPVAEAGSSGPMQAPLYFRTYNGNEDYETKKYVASMLFCPMLNRVASGAVLMDITQ
jgi:alpha-D-ribose 1-methylphosphonate 5-triphosphate synthase subunit PhnG